MFYSSVVLCPFKTFSYCFFDFRHVNKLRELHGFEILHSCMKLIT